MVFFREKQLEVRIDLVAKSLPIIDQIGALEKEKKIEPEAAELLKRKILSGTGKFIKAGVLIPELDAASAHSPRLLMAPAPKLLGTAMPEVSETTQEARDGSRKRDEDIANIESENSPDLEALTEDEREVYLRLSSKLRSRKGGASYPVFEED